MYQQYMHAVAYYSLDLYIHLSSVIHRECFVVIVFLRLTLRDFQLTYLSLWTNKAKRKTWIIGKENWIDWNMFLIVFIQECTKDLMALMLWHIWLAGAQKSFLEQEDHGHSDFHHTHSKQLKTNIIVEYISKSIPVGTSLI